MIAKVGGWLSKIPAEAAFLEFEEGDFDSRYGPTAGRVIAYDDAGNRLQCKSLGLPNNEAHWTQRIPKEIT